MKTSNLAYRNFKGNFYRYIMYALSNSFAVTAFFIFANFVFHPAIDLNDLGGHQVAAAGARSGMIMSQIIIVLFSVLFVGYSTSIFLKSRGKEFGLLSLYGMTKKQIRKYVAKENTLLSLLSLVVGISVGMVFSKFFLLIMENFLDLNLAFNISLKAVGLTAIVFFILFELTSYLMLFKIKDKEIAEEMRSARTPKELPSFSKVKGILGLVLLVMAYAVAWFVTGGAVVAAMIPVTIVTIVASYFIFTQFSIYFASKLKKSKKVRLNKVNLIAYSQLIFKLKDTAKVMFLAAILSAVSFTATETVVSFYTEIDRITGLDVYEDLGVSIGDDYGKKDQLVEDVNSILADGNASIKSQESVNLIKLENLRSTEGHGVNQFTVAIPESQYNIALKARGEDLLKLKQGQGQYLHVDARYDPNILVGEASLKYDVEKTELKLGNKKLEIELPREKYGIAYQLPRMGYTDAYVLNDQDFESLYKASQDDDRVEYFVYTFENPAEEAELGGKVSQKIFDKYSVGGEDIGDLRIFPKGAYQKESKNSFGTILFIAFFIAFLFFIASGSMIYFKLFNEIKEDKLEYDILSKVGMNEGDLKKIVTKQMLILFFLPFIVGVTHSLFALKSLSNLLHMNLIRNGLLVAVGFLAFQIFYFFVIRSIYMKKLEEY